MTRSPRRGVIRAELPAAVGFVGFCAAALFVIPFFQP